MPVIEYKNLKKYLTDLKKEKPFPVYLIHGEEYLYRSSFKELLDVLLPGSGKSFNYEEIDGTVGNIYDVTESLNTFSFLSKTKVVAYTDAKIFYSKNDEERLLDNAGKAYKKDEMKKAAKFMASLLGILGIGFDDIRGDNRKKLIKIKPELFEDEKFPEDIIEYATENAITVPAARDSEGILKDTIEKGFPKGNILIITTDLVDKRKGLFKAIKKNGLIFDCSVPKGSRMADKKAQEEMMNDVMKGVLAKSGKKLDPDAYRMVVENTGFNLNTFVNNLEMLITYAGDEARITKEHAASLLKRTREDPIYELTGAIADRNTGQALFYLASLLSTNIYPLQILSAMINQIRKLIILKDFTKSAYGMAWNKGLAFHQFKTNVMPAIVNYDKDILHAAESLDALFDKKNSEEKKKKPGKTDLMISKNPNNPYPVFQSLIKSENFSKEELITSLETLSQADLRLKTSRLAHKVVLEDAIIKICRRKSTDNPLRGS